MLGQEATEENSNKISSIHTRCWNFAEFEGFIVIIDTQAGNAPCGLSISLHLAQHAAVSHPHPVAGVDYPRTLQEFDEWFPTEEACAAYLGRLRWPDGFCCPACGVAAMAV